MMSRHVLMLVLVLACGCFDHVGPHGIDVGDACKVSDALPPCDEGCASISTTDDSGFCTFRCRSNSDCPDGTACIDSTYSDNTSLLDHTTSPYFVCAQRCDKDANACAGYTQTGFTCTQRQGVVDSMASGSPVEVCFLPE